MHSVANYVEYYQFRANVEQRIKMCSWLTLRLYAEDGRIAWESVRRIYTRKFESSALLCSNDVMYVSISATTDYDCGT